MYTKRSSVRYEEKQKEGQLTDRNAALGGWMK
jgi:hypothetical protein